MLVVQSIENDLKEVKAALQQQEWNKALSALDRAEGRVGGVRRNALSASIFRYRKELELVGELDKIRLERANSKPGTNRFGTAAKSYEDVFRQAGLPTFEEDPDARSAAKRIRSIAVAPRFW